MKTRRYELRAPEGDPSGGGSPTLITTPPADPNPAPPGGGNPNPAPPAADDWRSKFSDEIKNDPTMAKFKNVEDLAKSYIYIQKTVGHDKIVLPGKDADESTWKEVYKKLGAPETPDKYEFNLEKESPIDDKFINGIREVAHKSGLHPKQAQAVVQHIDKITREHLAASKSELENNQKVNIDNLKKEWAGEYDKNIYLAQKAFSAYADEESIKYLNETGLGNDPKLLKIFAKIGQTFREDGQIDNGNGPKFLSASEVQESINSILNNPKHPYYDKEHVDHPSALKEVKELFEQKGKLNKK